MQSQFNRAFHCPPGTQHLGPSLASLSPISVISEEGLGGGGGTKREERAAPAVAITMKVRARLMVQ